MPNLTKLFVGTIIDDAGISLGANSSLLGRVLSFASTVTLGDNATITVPACVVPPVPGSGSHRGSINVVKLVINDNGGTKMISDFPLFVNGTPVTSGLTNGFSSSANPYEVTETSDSKYKATFSGDCDANGHVTLNSGDAKFCIITNDDIGAPVVVPPIPPLIDVVKVPSPLALPGGPGKVDYTYWLRNMGTVPVTDITMVGDTCSPIVLATGDVNGDSKLDVNETWTYRCSTNLTETHTNTVVATGWANGLSATDIASATVIVGKAIVPPLIHLTKIPAPLALRAGGGVVLYTETITNPGTVALENVRINDDKCASLQYVDGDTNHDSLLQSTETWTYTCRTTLTKTTTNTAVASGEANGLTVRDFAIATVVVATAPVMHPAAPKFPNTGVDPSASALPLAAAGIVAAALAAYAVTKKQNV